jgi:hypothetical protein
VLRKWVKHFGGLTATVTSTDDGRTFRLLEVSAELYPPTDHPSIAAAEAEWMS